jgi:thymidylate synthase (FAD)
MEPLGALPDNTTTPTTKRHVMKIVKPEAHYLGKVPTDYEGTLKFIEMAGRTCYRSEDKITPGSAEKFVRKLIAAGHLAMVEHSNFVVRILDSSFDNLQYIRDVAGKYLNVARSVDGYYVVVGGNLTAWYQRGSALGWRPSLFSPFLTMYGSLFRCGKPLVGPETQWMPCPFDEIPPELHRHTVRFICDRGVSHELVRHRPCSFAQESTRYVNYGGKEMEFVAPAGFDGWNKVSREMFEDSCISAEYRYGVMLNDGLSPQQARAVLPNALRTEIVVTADASEWAHIKKLRTAPSAHPDMRRLMSMVPWEEIV